MLRSIFSTVIAFAFAWVATAADSGELDKLQGKWEAKKTREDGQKVTQTIELKKEKMLFKIMGSAGETVFVARADVKPQKAGAFNTFIITNIKAGNSEDSLEPAGEERSYIYQVGDQTLTIVSNIDAERDQPPQLDVYKKISAGK